MKFERIRTTPVQVWTIDDIAAYLKRGKGSIRALANDPDFPTPITPGARSRRWFADEVLAYLRQNRNRTVRQPGPTFAAPARHDIDPRNIRIKGSSK